jgi:hypothetical protein
MQEWAESVWIAISVIICAAVVSVAVVLNDIGRNIINEVQEDRRATAAVQEYRKLRQWDEVQVYPQDIVSLVLETRGDPPVIVFNTNPNFLDLNPTWEELVSRRNAIGGLRWYLEYNPTTGAFDKVTTATTDFSAKAITDALSIDRMYQSYVATDPNGAVVCYWLYKL